DKSFIAEKFGKAHTSVTVLSSLPWRRGCQERLDPCQYRRGDFFGWPHSVLGFVKTFDRRPSWAPGQEIVHGGSVFGMAKAGFLQVLFGRGIGADGFPLYQGLCFARRHAQM